LKADLGRLWIKLGGDNTKRMVVKAGKSVNGVGGSKFRGPPLAAPKADPWWGEVGEERSSRKKRGWKLTKSHTEGMELLKKKNL